MDLHADIGAIWGATDLDTEHKAVLTVVRYHADENGDCRVTFDRIESMTGLGRRTVIRRMADLVALKIVDRLTDKRDGNLYRLNLSSAPQALQKCPPDTTVVPQGHLSSATQTPQKCPGDTTGLIDVLCGSDVATRTTELQNKEQATAATTAGAHVHTHAHEAPVATNEAGELIELWVQTQAGTGSRGPGMFASHAAQAAIVELVATHKAERVRWAIGRAVEIATRGAPSLGMLRKLCEEGPLPERPSGQSFSAPKPQRPHSSAGIWAKHGMPIPEPNRGTEGEF